MLKIEGNLEKIKKKLWDQIANPLKWEEMKGKEKVKKQLPFEYDETNRGPGVLKA